MRKISIFIIAAALLVSGCATYSFEKGKAPYDKGYVVARYGRVLPEYTIGKNNSVPAEKVARERFQRRKEQVESYYKKMGYIENRFKQTFIDPPLFMLGAVIGMFRLPYVAYSDYKYNHDPKYKESVDKREAEEYKAEKVRIKSLKDQLNAYIQEDLKKEGESPVSQEMPAMAKEKAGEAPLAKEPEPAKEPLKEGQPPAQQPKITGQEAPLPKEEAAVRQTPPPPEAAVKAEEKAAPVVEAKPPVETRPLEIKPQKPHAGPTAVIIAKPMKGVSPLTVRFYGSKSFSPKGRIISYFWDFGDGDTSTNKNPTNTYWSTTYGSRTFGVTLTVKDDKGATASSSATIEVLTR